MTTERLLAIDVGLGTADILIVEPGQRAENSVKLVVPSRTQIVARQIRAATAHAITVVFQGPVMGGGASTRAMHDHLAAGLPFLATEEAALTFADNLEQVEGRGVTLISEDEARSALQRGARLVRSGDIDFDALRRALTELGVEPTFSGAAIAVQDHGFNPHGSNRVFRFAFWQRALADRRPLVDLFYASAEIPSELTRMRAAAALLSGVPRVMAADTGPAALYGALEEGVNDAVLINVGNGHTVCAVALEGRLAGVFEHHTGKLDRPTLESFIRRFLAGELSDEEVRQAGGHGAALGGPVPASLPIFVTGPHRALLAGTSLPVTFPAPWGDMMLTGAIGLLKAFAHRYRITLA
jgi:uncharacterized protein (DUF1786 family)